MKRFQPRDQVAVVTGGASGIGRALCQALIAGGARHVIVADMQIDMARSVAEELGGASGRATAAGLDVSDAAAVFALAEQVESDWGGIDLWCSNAGINAGQGLGGLGDWQRSLGVNVMGHVHAAQAVIPGMRTRGNGCFVVTASAAGLLSDFRAAPYTASKHAAVALAEWLAITCCGDGISVHCICPEGVRTAMTKASSAQAGKGMVFLEAEDVARHALERIAEGEFLILPHPRVAEYEVRRASERQRWIESMHKAYVRTQASGAAVN
jgi:NAD(P)-dependent dehydrogenase (short-subunit alcohol dehydrogenase family)